MRSEGAASTVPSVDAGLGTRPVSKLALALSIPTIVAQGANVSYTIIDRLFIGHIPQRRERGSLLGAVLFRISSYSCISEAY